MNTHFTESCKWLIISKMQRSKNMDLYGKNFLKMTDLTADDITGLIDLSARLKDEKKKGLSQLDYLKGKNIALIFEKTSTRTRC